MTTTTTSIWPSAEAKIIRWNDKWIVAFDSNIAKETDEKKKVEYTARKDQCVNGIRVIVSSMVKSSYTPTEPKALAVYNAYKDQATADSNEWKTEKEVFDFVRRTERLVMTNETFVVRVWYATGHIIKLAWRGIKGFFAWVWKGVKWVWDKTCDAFAWVVSKIKGEKEAAPAVAPVSPTPVVTTIVVTPEVASTVVEVTPEAEAAVEAPEAPVVTEATPVATPVEQAAPEAAEAVTEVVPEVVETLVVEAEVINSIEELDTFILGDVAEEVSPVEDTSEEAVATVEEVVPVVPFQWNGVTDDETSTRARIAAQYAETAIGQGQTVESFATQHGITVRVAEGVYAYRLNEMKDDAEVATVEVVADAIPAALTAGAPAPKAPNTKVKPSRPSASKPKAVKAKKA